MGMIFGAHSTEHPPKFDGLFGRTDISSLTHLAHFFLPYNPVVVEIGAYEGVNTLNLAKSFQDGIVIAFEPNPRAFERLSSAVKQSNLDNIRIFNLAINNSSGKATLYLDHGDSCNDPQFEKFSSLLKKVPSGSQKCQCPFIEVSCVTLDDWCENNQISRIDFIQIDAEGNELQILKRSRNILKTVKVICTKTYFSLARVEATQFLALNKFLESMGFEMLAHWYLEGLEGEATFIRKEFYNALYR